MVYLVVQSSTGETPLFSQEGHLWTQGAEKSCEAGSSCGSPPPERGAPGAAGLPAGPGGEGLLHGHGPLPRGEGGAFQSACDAGFCICMYVYTYIYIHIHIHICIGIHIHTYIYIYMYILVDIYIYIHIHVCIYIVWSPRRAFLLDSGVFALHFISLSSACVKALKNSVVVDLYLFMAADVSSFED